jgi:hypothetical protein
MLFNKNKNTIDIVWGDTTKGMKISSKIFHLLFLARGEHTGPIYHPEIITTQLKNTGFSVVDVYEIRRVITKSFYISMKKISKMYNIDKEYISNNNNLFGRYQFYFNVSSEIKDEFYSLAKKLSIHGLKKLELNVTPK